MTTIVRKGQNRKAAEAKRAKHAQRTPLPTLDLPADAIRGLNSDTATIHWARPTGHDGQLEQLCGIDPKQRTYLSSAPDDAAISCKRCLSRYGDNSVKTSKIKEIAPVTIKQRSSADDFDKMSLSQLQQMARAQGWRGTEHATKEVLVDTLRKHPLGAPMDAAPLAVPPSKSKEDDGGDMAKTKTSRTITDMGKVLGQRIALARENGYSRKVIADASGLTQSVIWRIQAKERVKAHEVDAITEALDRIERGEVQPTRRGRPAGETQTPRRGSRAVLQSKLDRIEEILSDVAMTSTKPTEYREAINRALDVINE